MTGSAPALQGQAFVSRRYQKKTGRDKVLDTFYLSRTSSCFPHIFRIFRSVLVHPLLPSGPALAVT